MKREVLKITVLAELGVFSRRLTYKVKYKSVLKVI